MPGQGRPARDETGWRAGDAGCRGGDVGHRPLDAAPPTGGARPRGAGQQPAAAGVLAALARVAVGSVERLSGAVRLKQMVFFTQYMYPCWAGPRVCRAIPVQPTGSAYAPPPPCSSFGYACLAAEWENGGFFFKKDDYVELT